MGSMLKGMGATPLNMPILLIFAMLILAAVMFMFMIMFMLPAPIMNIAALGRHSGQ